MNLLRKHAFCNKIAQLLRAHLLLYYTGNLNSEEKIDARGVKIFIYIDNIMCIYYNGIEGTGENMSENLVFCEICRVRQKCPLPNMKPYWVLNCNLFCGIIIIVFFQKLITRNEVLKMEDKTISFIAGRKRYTIPTDDILYILMKKQDAYVHLSNGNILKTRMTFAEFQEELGDDFIRIHRGGLVAAKAIHSVNRLITLSNGESLEYSTQHREDIMRKFREKQRIIIDAILDNDNPTENEEYHKHYQCFDTMPIAFTDIEMVFDEESQAMDWIFRYGNEALAKLEECPLEVMIGNTFGSIFPNMDKKWLRSYERTVLYGETIELIDYSPEVDKYLRIICFPTFKGHCGCMLFDISETRITSEKSMSEKAILMYLRKIME